MVLFKCTKHANARLPAPLPAHWYAISIARRRPTSPPFDLANPRVWVNGLNHRASLERTGQQVGKKLASHEWLVIQAEAAQANAFEHLPMFGIAMVRSSNAFAMSSLSSPNS